MIVLSYLIAMIFSWGLDQIGLILVGCLIVFVLMLLVSVIVEKWGRGFPK